MQRSCATFVTSRVIWRQVTVGDGADSSVESHINWMMAGPSNEQSMFAREKLGTAASENNGVAHLFQVLISIFHFATWRTS